LHPPQVDQGKSRQVNAVSQRLHRTLTRAIASFFTTISELAGGAPHHASPFTVVLTPAVFGKSLGNSMPSRFRSAAEAIVACVPCGAWYQPGSEASAGNSARTFRIVNMPPIVM